MPPDDDKYSRIDYRRLIAWPERIRREAPLLEEVLGSGPSKRILDLGSGTGEHARYLVSQGYQVVGIDASESMIDKARDQTLPAGLEFHHADIREVESVVDGSFGGAICLGNTLPHLKEPGDLERLFEGLRTVLEPGAALLLQVLNYHRILTRKVRHLPVNFRQDEEGEIVFLRLMEPEEDGRVLFFPSTLRLRPGQDPPLEIVAAKEVHLRGWRYTEVESALDKGGFGEHTLLGSFDSSPFEPDESADLVVVAR
ncbi:MAG: class I SAM-dependent methyltransferase [Acidobacteria bacterium]|nr:MAG: class I SAM-dependent methyltransferase [Acidobacteriota bacterium]